MPIDGVLDLHTFSPKELPSLLDDYFEECLKQGIIHVRVIHGKGKGILRDRVRSLLKRHRLVESFGPATETGGGWGATLVTLRGR
jgi:DNA-nicking Smr family endonuclease